MRTTLTLDDELAARLHELARQRRTSFKAVVNEVLKRGLSQQSTAQPRAFKVKPHRSAFLPGIDPLRLNQLVDELEIDDFIAEAKKGS